MDPWLNAEATPEKAQHNRQFLLRLHLLFVLYTRGNQYGSLLSMRQARLFPVLTRNQGQAVSASSGRINTVMWMQDVQEHAAAAAVTTACSSSSPPGGDVSLPPISGDRGGGVAAAKPVAVKNWLAAERLSFKEILAKADPGAEFRWRRDLEEGMAAKVPAAGAQAAAAVGSGR